MTDPSPAEKIAILRRTADWLEANPEKALRGSLAQNDKLLARLPSDADATCFCFVGRLVVEAGIGSDDDLSYRTNVRDWLAPLGSTPGSFYNRNDSHFTLPARLRALRGYIDRLEMDMEAA